MTDQMTIRELAQATGVSAHTIRYYERAGLIPDVKRDESSNHRRFTERHVRWMTFLRRLRQAGMPVSKVKEYVELLAQGTAGDTGRMVLLAEHRATVAETIETLEGHLAVLDNKLSHGCGPDAATRTNTNRHTTAARS